MKKVFLALTLAVGLAGCAGSPLQNASKACETYYAAQQTTQVLKDARKITAAQLAPYKDADAAVTKTCVAPPPTTAASAAETVSKVTTQTAILIELNKKAQTK